MSCDDDQVYPLLVEEGAKPEEVAGVTENGAANT